MTETEWLTCTDPGEMWTWLEQQKGWLRWLAEHSSTLYWRPSRKELLFASAFCRLARSGRCQEYDEALGVAERYAEDNMARSDFRKMHLGYALPRHFFSWESEVVQKAHLYNSPEHADEQRQRHFGYCTLFCNVFREVFGNPFRSVTVRPGWRVPKIVSLAQSIYDDRAFDRLPVLADALELAGCTNADILAHCRHPGPHVRGCWVLDLLLGKS